MKERGGAIIFEWPDHIMGWQLEEVKELKEKYNLKQVTVHGCCLGLMDQETQRPTLKPWKFMTNVEEIAEAFSSKWCKRVMIHEHIKREGKRKNSSGRYPDELANLIHESLVRRKKRRKRRRNRQK